MELLINNNKIVVVITHDPLLGLYGEKRIIMENGGVKKVIERTKTEETLINKLYKEHRKNEELRAMLRSGLEIKNGSIDADV